MEISVGQPYHEGKKLEAAMDWARANFKNIYLIVADTSQRFNVMFKTGYSESNAEKIAYGAGTEWIDRNLQYLDGVIITRWDEWRRRPECIMNRSAVSRLYTEDAAFRKTITDAMGEFSKRHDIIGSDMHRYLALTEQYLLEETAVFATAFKELGGISAYPGTFLETWEACIESNNPNIPAGLKNSHWTRLTFDKVAA